MKTPRSILYSTRGMSLVEALIAMGILAISSAAMMTMIVNQNREVRFLTQKLAVNDLQAVAQKSLNNGEFCQCFFKGNTFNKTSKSWNSFPSKLESGFETNCTPKGSPYLVVNEEIPNTSLKVSALAMKDITEVVSGSGSYVAKIQMTLDHSTLIRSIKDVEVPVSFSLDMSTGSDSARNVGHCSSGSLSKGLQDVLLTAQAYEQSACINGNAFTVYEVTSQCPAGRALLSCTGGPGDLDETDEGYWIDTNFGNNSCTLHIVRPKCGDTSGNNEVQKQRVSAICYKLEG